MKNRIIYIIFIIFILLGCSKENVNKRDILIESVQNYDEIFNTSLFKGRHIFSKYCSVCHGLEGKGDGFNAFNLNPKPRDFTDSTFIANLDTSLLIETITNGGKSVGLSAKMPPWGKTLSDNDIKNVADFIISISRH